MTREDQNYLFVYGSLRPLWRNLQTIGGARAAKQALKLKATHLGGATVNGHLYDLGRYPGVICCPEAPEVQGDLFAINDVSLLRTLDRYEACDQFSPAPHEYRRVQVMVKLNGQSFASPVWIYEYTGDGREGTPVSHGDWLSFCP